MEPTVEERVAAGFRLASRDYYRRQDLPLGEAELEETIQQAAENSPARVELGPGQAPESAGLLAYLGQTVYLLARGSSHLPRSTDLAFAYAATLVRVRRAAVKRHRVAPEMPQAELVVDGRRHYVWSTRPLLGDLLLIPHFPGGKKANEFADLDAACLQAQEDLAGARIIVFVIRATEPEIALDILAVDGDDLAATLASGAIKAHRLRCFFAIELSEEICTDLARLGLPASLEHGAPVGLDEVRSSLGVSAAEFAADLAAR